MERRGLSAVGVVALLVSSACLVPDQPREIDVSLFDALGMRDYDKATKLLEEGADINARFQQRNGKTVLAMGASMMESPELMTFLLEHGADPNVPDDGGTTPLMYAAQLGHTETCTLLLEHGADPTLTDKLGETALSRARARDREDTAAFLEKWMADHGGGG